MTIGEVLKGGGTDLAFTSNGVKNDGMLFTLQLVCY